MKDIFVNYIVKLMVSGDLDNNDLDAINKIALKIGSLFRHECILSFAGDGTFLYKIKDVWKFPGDEGWLCQMNTKKLFKDFNKEQCKLYLNGIEVKGISDTFIEKILMGKIEIQEEIYQEEISL